MANKKYTDLFSVLNDVDLYMTVRRGDVLTLGLLQPLARGRWQWLVDNWNISLYQRFKTFADGDNTLEQRLEDLDRLVTSYRLGNNRNPLDSFDTFVLFSKFLSTIRLSELALSAEEKILVALEQQRVQDFVIEDFRAMTFYLRQQQALDSYRIGLGDPIGGRLNGAVPVARQRSATIGDLSQLDDALQILKFIEGIIIDFKNTQDKAPDLISIANRNLGPNSTTTFNDTYRSSVAVPFEFNLQHMAKKYLGSEDLYFELVTINKLQPPYIDEVGQKLLLLAPGAVNNIIVPGTLRDSMPVGTKLNIGSYRIREESRIVEKVVENTDGSLIVFLSGAQDLSKLKTTEGAFIRVYAPRTLNSGSFVLIPLTVASPNAAKYTPSSDQLRRLETALLNFGVDILRDEKTRGLVVDANGNLAFAAGLVNVRQAVLSALKTTQGELTFHPEYGVSVQIGDKYYGTTDEAVIFANALRDTLLRDPRYEDIQILGLQTTGTGISLSLLVSVQGVGAPIPLSFVS